LQRDRNQRRLRAQTESVSWAKRVVVGRAWNLLCSATMTRKQVIRLGEPATFALTICVGALALSGFKFHPARGHVPHVNALSAGVSASNDPQQRRSSAPSELEFDGYLAACAAGNASACNKLDGLRQRMLETRARLAARHREDVGAVTRGGITSYARQ
jgi:Tfp pilus assembly protein PilW